MPEFLDDVEFAPKPRSYATGPRGPRKRSDTQKLWDAEFARRMTENGGKGFLYAQVTPDTADDAKKRVAAAARLYDRATTEGEPRPGKAKGTVLLSWKIRVADKRTPKTAAVAIESTTKPAESKPAAGK